MSIAIHQDAGSDVDADPRQARIDLIFVHQSNVMNLD
jgi:hypothetical protein